MTNYTKEELQQKVNALGPWHYCHQFPHGIFTGTCTSETVHDKLQLLLNANLFNRLVYSRVLDLGANSGIISMWFADHKRSMVDAYELGPKYYPQLELAVEVKNYQNKVVPFNKDIRNCDFELLKYDLVLFLGTMHHIAKETHFGVLKACKNALVPGGELVVQTKSDLPVSVMLKELGFLDVTTYPLWLDRTAWSCFKDPMKL